MIDPCPVLIVTLIRAANGHCRPEDSRRTGESQTGRAPQGIRRVKRKLNDVAKGGQHDWLVANRVRWIMTHVESGRYKNRVGGNIPRGSSRFADHNGVVVDHYMPLTTTLDTAPELSIAYTAQADVYTRTPSI